MKNKKIVCTILLFLIVLLVGVTGFYYQYKKMEEVDKVFETDKKLKEDVEKKEANIPKVAKLEKSSNPGLKEVETFAELDNYLSGDKNVYIVLGQEGCTYCERSMPILKEVAAEQSIDIIYVDLKKFSEEDYQKLMNTQLIIPGKCNKYFIDIPLSKGFGTPLTLFVNNNETIDCIRGYKDKKNLMKFLNENYYIIENK